MADRTAYAREYRRTHRTQIREQRHEYYERVDGARFIRDWRARNLEKKRAYNEAWNARHPEKRSAQLAVHSAILRGRIPPAKELTCVDCGQSAHEYDHHLGYAPEHKLTVQPVCRKCHGARRRIPG